jgi:hypothetical protein
MIRSHALRLAALGLFGAALIAFAISSDPFGASTLGTAQSSRPILIQDGRDISEPIVVTPTVDDAMARVAPSRPARRQPNRLARVKRTLPPPPVATDTAPLAPLPPPAPAPMVGVAVLVPR